MMVSKQSNIKNNERRNVIVCKDTRNSYFSKT